jgi:opacity protein-like surface antigen
LYNFLFGPTFSYNKLERVKPFAHTLFGVSHASAGFLGFGGSDNAFAMALGGGVDAGVHKNVAVRLVQADYFLTRFGSQSQNSARISTGLMLRF